MKLYRISLITSAIFALSSCSNNFRNTAKLNYSDHYANKESSSNPVENGVKKLGKNLASIERESNNLNVYPYSDKNSNSSPWGNNKIFNSSVTATSGKGFNVELGVNQSTDYLFKPGHYVIDKDSNQAKLTVVFIQKSLELVMEHIERLGLNYVIEVTFSASADGIKPSKKARYYGEFGSVVKLEASYTLLNGRMKGFNINSGENLSNADYAALRAYGMARIVDDEIGLNKIANYKFDLKTFTSIGAKYRVASIIVKVSDT